MDAAKRTIKSNRANDVLLDLKIIDGKAPKNSIGLTDNRLFTGDNKLHAKLDKQTGRLWYLEMDKGELPPFLKQKFTGLDALMKTVTQYYKTRNVSVAEVLK